MWGHIATEGSYQTNFNVGFASHKSDVLIQLSQWQYWWWFWFALIWVLYFYIIISALTKRAALFNPTLNTSLRSHGKWGDFLIAILPLSWCANILINSNYIMRLLEWQTEGSLFTIRIQGKQWYWVYKYDNSILAKLYSAPYNVGRNKWKFHQYLTQSSLSAKIRRGQFGAQQEFYEFYGLLLKERRALRKKTHFLKNTKPTNATFSSLSRAQFKFDKNSLKFMSSSQFPFFFSYTLHTNFQGTGFWTSFAARTQLSEGLRAYKSLLGASGGVSLKSFNPIFSSQHSFFQNTIHHFPRGIQVYLSPQKFILSQTWRRGYLGHFENLAIEDTWVWDENIHQKFLTHPLRFLRPVITEFTLQNLSKSVKSLDEQVRIFKQILALKVNKSNRGFAHKTAFAEDFWGFRQKRYKRFERFSTLLSTPQVFSYVNSIQKAQQALPSAKSLLKFPQKISLRPKQGNLWVKILPQRLQRYVYLFSLQRKFGYKPKTAFNANSSLGLFSVSLDFSCLSKSKHVNLPFQVLKKGNLAWSHMISATVPQKLNFTLDTKNLIWDSFYRRQALARTISLAIWKGRARQRLLGTFLLDDRNILKKIISSSKTLQACSKLLSVSTEQSRSLKVSKALIFPRLTKSAWEKSSTLRKVLASKKFLALHSYCSQINSSQRKIQRIPTTIRSAWAAALYHKVFLNMKINPKLAVLYRLKHPTLRPSPAEIWSKVLPFKKHAKQYAKFVRLRAIQPKLQTKSHRLAYVWNKVLSLKKFSKVRILLLKKNRYVLNQAPLWMSHLPVWKKVLPFELSRSLYFLSAKKPLKTTSSQQLLRLAQQYYMPKIEILPQQLKQELSYFSLKNGLHLKFPFFIKPAKDLTNYYGLIIGKFKPSVYKRYLRTVSLPISSESFTSKDWAQLKLPMAVKKLFINRSLLASSLSQQQQHRVSGLQYLGLQFFERLVLTAGRVSNILPKVNTISQYLVQLQHRMKQSTVTTVLNTYSTIAKRKAKRLLPLSASEKFSAIYKTHDASITYRAISSAREQGELIPLPLAERLLRTRRILVLPAHVNLTLIANSYDVVHSWYIPGLGLKFDCVPGRSTHHSLYIDNIGFYYGQCAEICGRYHHHMPVRICALPFESFLAWWQTRGLHRICRLKHAAGVKKKMRQL